MKTITINNLTKLSYTAEEAFNRLRVNLGFCGSEFKKIIITSSVDDEGKSTIAMQLMLALANSGKRVCLVDADMRKSVLRTRHHFALDNPSDSMDCLEEYLSGVCTVKDVVYKTSVKNAYMVPTSYNVTNPAVLIQNQRFEILVNILEREFDYVLIDTPPLALVSDGAFIASMCDGAVLVVRSGLLSKTVVGSSIRQLEAAGCPLMGTVINGAELENGRYYSKYGKYGQRYYRKYKNAYGYGYGYGYGCRKESGDNKSKES